MPDTFVPFANPHAAYIQRERKIMEAVSQVFDSGQYILGQEVEKFEQSFASWLCVRHAVGCANGTDALELTLRALGAGAGKAVFTVSHTAVATVAAIERAGAVPVLVDIDPRTYTMNQASLEEAIRHIQKSPLGLAPSVIIPVHLYGHPCDMDAILALAEQHGCMVIEDCAQAHGARYKGNMAGSLGRAAAFSFYPTKNLGTLGDGGAAATDDAAMAAEMIALRQYGWKERYISAVPGINSRLDPVQAAILSIQLEHLDIDNAARKRIAAIYNKELSGCGLTLPVAAPWAEHVFHLYVALCPERPAFMDFLKAKDIGTAVHYPEPIHLQPAYRDRILLAPDGLPVTESIRDKLISLPMFPQLEEQDVARVCEAVRDWTRAGG